MSLIQYQSGSSGSSTDFGGFVGMMQEGVWEQPRQSYSVPGVVGSAHLVHARTSRPLSCSYRIHGYATRALAEAALRAIDALTDTLFGTVSNTVSGDTVTWENCTFMGYERGEIRYDGSGEHGWWVEGRLNWIQRVPNA